MALSMVKKPDTGVSKGAAVIGSSVAAIQAALTLAQMGVEVKVITNSAALGWEGATNGLPGNSSLDQRFLWPLLLRAESHPLIKLYTGAEVESIEGNKGDFQIQVLQRPRYIHEDICTGCGRCQVECSARVTSMLGGQRITHTAIHTPLLGAKSVPSAYVIDRNGLAPCHVACPLGINVQGFVSLLANNKTDRALALINEAAPLSGILGRVCKHPCEDNCNRPQVDSPVSIRALHRYAADNASGGIKYSRKFPASSRGERIAIVGSGPAGLTAAWQLARLGYSPTVFESHGVIGGMLATGIPRFRLPREVREREIAAIIKDLGIDIRTGITVGRDVTFAYLKERGYRAFFLSIGAERNSKLSIPGEGLEGVVDCMSLLLTLNLKVDTFVGSNVVMIGDGNSAIDSARAVIRRSKGTVRVLSWTIPEEVTAAEEEVEEALQERVSIEYRTVPVEILGDGRRVTGIRCQRTRLTNEIMANGRHRPEPIPATDFIIEADHVVVAVGQSPNASQLNMDGLAIDSNTGVIQVNPLTLETSIPGVFAGGDCITGPNNVVDAVAAGLRAAESIRRYLQGGDLEAGRSLEPPRTAEIDIETVEVSPYKRAPMPAIRLRKRINSFEETTTGLSAEAAQREAQRCLNCALCSQCMECARVCEPGAVFHDDSIRRFEIGAQTILSFPSSAEQGDAAKDNAGEETTTEGVYIISPGSNGELTHEVMKAMAVALETAIEIKPKEAEETQIQDFAERDANLAQPRWASEQSEGRMERTGVFLCCCGGSISSVIDFRTVARKLSGVLGVTCIREIAQACTEAGARQIASQVTVWELDRVVLAGCACCDSEQVCYSCTDRRVMCQHYLNQHVILPHNTIVEFVNIREQCAWVHKDDPEGRTRKAVQIISSGVTRAKVAPPTALERKPILPCALIIGGELVAITAARALASRGYKVELVARQGLKQAQHEGSETTPQMLAQLQEKGVIVKPWPDALELRGSPGNYQAGLEYGSQVDCVTTGAVLVDVEELNRGASPLLNTSCGSRFLHRIISRTNNSGYLATVGADLLREVTIKETSGIFVLAPDGAESPKDQVLRGFAAAARVSTYLDQGSISPRATAVNVDSKLCRGCGNCAAICPYIDMRHCGDGMVYAYVDKALCLGCGACIASCPTGAITQHLLSDRQIISTLRSMLRPGQRLGEV
jgi:NADPH-dependent glutamate synthase beta subunit-like oxidoreductase/NAD-dependent dihydropyrimidine dehydrogenase PreA subunit